MAGAKEAAILLGRSFAYWVILLAFLFAVEVVASPGLIVFFVVPLLAVAGLAYEVWQFPRDSWF
jgi:hypothetical protein